MDQLDVEILVHLLAQVVDVDVDEVGARVEMGVPHLLGDLDAADHSLGVLGQVDQQVVFLG